MTRENKDNVTVCSAIAMLVFGCVLTTIGFFLEPMGEVHDSVLWVLGQCFIYAGGALGIANYVRVAVKQESEERWREFERRRHHGVHADSVHYADGTEDTEQEGGDDETEA